MAAPLARAYRRRLNRKEWEARWPPAMDADVYAAVVRRRERHAETLASDMHEVELGALPESVSKGHSFELPEGHPYLDASTPRSVVISTMTLGSPKMEELEFTDAELMLRQDFCKNKVCWYDHWWKDLWCFLINMNPLLSICYSHPLHPIGRFERLLVYAVSFIWVTLVATSLAEAQLCVQCSITSCDDRNGTCEAAYGQGFNSNATTYEGCHDDQAVCRDLFVVARRVFKPGLRHWDGVHFDEATHSFTVNFCCIADRMWAIWFLETFNSGMFHGMDLGGPAYSLVSNCIFSIGSFQLMLCGCVQFATYKRRKCGERIGYIVFGVITFMLLSTVVWLYPFVMQMRDGSYHMMRNFVLAKAGSWIGATFLNIFVFALIWPLQRPKARGPLKWMDPPMYPLPDLRGPIAKAAAPRFHVLAQEYIEYVRPAFDPEASLTLSRQPSFFRAGAKPVASTPAMSANTHSHITTSSKVTTFDCDFGGLDVSMDAGSDCGSPRQSMAAPPGSTNLLKTSSGDCP